MIIDCHVHVAARLTGFWEPLRYGKVRDRGAVWQQFPPAFDPPASPPEVLLGYMDQAGVEQAWMVQHHLYGDQNAVLIEAVKRWPDRLVGLAYLGMLDAPDAPEQLERLLDAGLAGLKVELGSTRRLRPAFRFDGPREWLIWERLDRRAAPLILDVNEALPGDLAALQRMLSEFTRLRLLICHLGGPFAPGWEQRALLASHPRVWTDLAYLPELAAPESEYPFPEAQGLVQWAVDTLGADKLLWGTDYPGTLNLATYPQLLDFVRRHCSFLSASQKASVLGGTAERFLRGA